MIAAIYARFSSDMQRDESIDAQVRACKEYAAAHGYEVVKVYADKAVSAKSDKRPEFQRMIKEAYMYDAVLVHKYNRFARRLKDHLLYEEKLNDQDCILTSVTEDFGQGKNSIIVKAVIQAMSQYYIMDLADEVRKGHKENALKAQFNGGTAPFGYDIVDKEYVINEAEAYWVQKMFVVAYNHNSFADLIRQMKAAGVKTKFGNDFQYSSIYEILRNEKYTGTYVYDPEVQKKNRRDKVNAIRIDNAIPAIVSRDVFDAVQEYRKEHTLTKTDYPLKGLVYCSTCGKKMTVHFSKSRNEQPYFYCASGHTGSIQMRFVEQAVKNYINLFLSPETLEELKVCLYRYQKEQDKEIRDFNEVIDKQIKEKQKTVESLVLKLAIVDDDMIEIITDQVRKLKEEIAALQLQEPPERFSPIQIERFVNNLTTDFSVDTIHALIERVEITNKKEVKVYSTLTSLLGNSPNYGGDTPFLKFWGETYSYNKLKESVLN